MESLELCHAPDAIQAASNGSSSHSIFNPETREARWTELLAVQRELESESLALGAAAFRRRLEKAEVKGRASNAGAAHTLLTKGLEPLEAAIRYFLTEQQAKRGVKHCAVEWLKKLSEHTVVQVEGKEKWSVLDCEGQWVATCATLEKAEERKVAEEALQPGVSVAAFMTLRAVLDHIGQRPSIHDVSMKITELLVDELRYRRFKKEAPGLFIYKMDTFRTGSYSYMARTLTQAMRYAEIDLTDLTMPLTHRVLIGTKLLDLLIQSTALIEIESNIKISPRKKFARELIMVPTEDTRAFMKKRNEILEFLSPVLMPMVIPPLQWTTTQRGGYRFALRNKHTLIRRAIKPSDDIASPTILAAVNAIQNTAWRINTPVYDLCREIESRRQLERIKVLDESLGDPPPKPEDIDTNEPARKKWRKLYYQYVQKQKAAENRLLEFERVMTTAKRIQGFDAFFFPHNLDFRGRVYPISHFLTPQGNDIQKGLLTFAVGKPLGSTGVSYLALHGMNCLDTTPEGQKVKRMTLDERVRYVVEHSAEILAVAKDPFSYSWWMEAEEPLQFFAFCLEWAGYVELAREGRGDEYVSHLPVSIDGSCNGLQHFSAMLKDPIGGRAVNVMPNETPQDVYDLVAGKVKDRLEALGTPNALLWLTTGLVSRDLVKRPTMTFSYGSKVYGFQKQVMQWLEEPKRWPKVKQWFPEDTVVEMSSLMANLIWDSLADVVVAAVQGMDWMQAVARKIAGAGKPVTWTVPLTGFVVRQDYYEIETKQIRTVLAGKVVTPRVSEKTNKILRHKQANAVSPNVIHSLDAAALMLAVIQAQADGVESFAAIHDSYGTLAADMESVWNAARSSFVKLYANSDVMADLASQFALQTPSTLPPPPTSGALDVAGVMASEYFFC